MATPLNTPLGSEAPDEIQRLILATREALTDSMVERLAATSGAALEIVDRLNDEETRAAVHTIIDRLTEFHRTGALDTLFQTVMVLHAARSAATDNIVERLFGFIEQVTNSLGSDALIKYTDEVFESLEVAADETAKHTAGGGIFSTLAMLSKPEAQQSLYFLLKFGEALRRVQNS